jgi:hypothetical protein
MINLPRKWHDLRSMGRGGGTQKEAVPRPIPNREGSACLSRNAGFLFKLRESGVELAAADMPELRAASSLPTSRALYYSFRRVPFKAVSGRRRNSVC